jgi:penicillin-insensitive murein endopeptidase
MLKRIETVSRSVTLFGCAIMAGMVCALARPAQAENAAAARQAAISWDKATAPTAAAPQAIGSYARGCQSGAMALPLTGVGYQILRPQRLRYYGQPSLLAFIRDLGSRMAPLGHGDLMIGDMSQPRGGPMSYGHSSHQSGLDVDIWLRFAHGRLSQDELRTPTPVSMVPTAATQRVDPTRWTQAQDDLIRLAAQTPGVARIFVNPAIKASLCERYNGQADWLHVLRPWRGHDEHIHVRLNCPPDNGLCESQDPIPAGTGCGADLMAWFQPPPPRKPSPMPNAAPPARKPMPIACDAVLAGQDGILTPASYR